MQGQEGLTEVLANLSIGYIVGAAFVLTLIRLMLVPNRSQFARQVAELVESLIVAGVLVFLIIRPFFLQAFYIPSESMEPTLAGHKSGFTEAGGNYDREVHDHIFVNKLIFRMRNPDRGDIVVFKAPKNADMMAKYENREQIENVLIKRCVAIPGDTVETKDDGHGKVQVYVNGKPRDEGSLKFLEPMGIPGEAQFATTGPVTLGADEYFMMGDNRNHSNDGRFWGPLKRDRVIGKAMFTFWPYFRMGILR